MSCHTFSLSFLQSTWASNPNQKLFNGARPKSIPALTLHPRRLVVETKSRTRFDDRIARHSRLRKKGTVQGLWAPKFRVFARTSEHPVATKVETKYKDDERTKVLTKNDDLASVFKNVVISGRKASKNPKKLSSDAAPSNLAHTLFPVLKYPLGTEAAMKQIIERNTLVFVVDKRADKPAIKDSNEKMFKIRAQKVNTSIAPDGTKKAFIMLTRDFKAVDLAKSFKIM